MTREEKIASIIAWTLVIGLWVVMALCSCSGVKYVTVEQVRRDSIYLTRVERDSIHVLDSVMVTVRGDTVWRDRWRVEYRDRLLTDTTYIDRCDTVQVPYPVEAKLTHWQRTSIALGHVLVGLVVIAIIVVFSLFIYKRFIT